MSNTNIKNRGWTQVLRKGNRCRFNSGTCRVQYTVLCITLYVCWFKIQYRVHHTLTYNSIGKNENNCSLQQLDLKFSFLIKPRKLHGFLISDTWPTFYLAKKITPDLNWTHWTQKTPRHIMLEIPYKNV